MNKKPRILLWDCETSPLVTYAWEIWEANAIKLLKDSQMLCYAFKWFGEKTVKVVGQDDFKGYKPGINNDKDLIKSLRELFDQAEVLIAHNGRSFDTKVAQARMIVHNIPPPSPFREIDTKTIAKRYGRFTSNKLDDLGKAMDLGQKLDTGGFKIWEGCMAGDEKSWQIMKRYNKQDVVLLEQLYLRLRPWIQNHPTMNHLGGKPESCPKCGTEGTLKPQGTRLTQTGTYQRFQCSNCLGWSSTRQADRLANKPVYV